MDNINNNKHQRIVTVIALLATASMLSLGAVAATTPITPAYAGGDGGDGVKQKAEAEADCDQKNKIEDGDFNDQDNFQGLCLGISANVNDLTIGGGVLANTQTP